MQLILNLEPAPEVRPAAAAAALHVSTQVVQRMLTSGVLPSLSYTDIGKLAQQPHITEGATAEGSHIPVLRLSDPDTDSDGRSIGYHVSYTDDELTGASLGYWDKRGLAMLPVTSGVLLVTVATVCIAVFEIDQGLETVERVGDRVRYSGRLIGRLDQNGDPVHLESSARADALLPALGLRINLGGGGPIARLPLPTPTTEGE